MRQETGGKDGMSPAKNQLNFQRWSCHFNLTFFDGQQFCHSSFGNQIDIVDINLLTSLPKGCDYF